MRPGQPPFAVKRSISVSPPAPRSAALAPRRLRFAHATDEAPPLVGVVAEIGVNHDGDVRRAVELVDAAAQCGADAVKLQLFDPDHLLSEQSMLAAYQAKSEDDVFAMLRRLQLGLDDMQIVRAAAARVGVGFVVTPFSVEEVEVLSPLDIDAVKIASPDAVNRPLLDAAVQLDRPLIVSTGTATLDELGYAADQLRGHESGGCFLQCVSSYPAATEDCGLGGMVAMGKRFRLPVGYSDHTNEMMSGAVAVAAGACVIEKHLTYDRQAVGPDHSASFEPAEFGEYVRRIRQASKMLGPIAKTVGDAELEVRDLCRQSVCLRTDMPAGHVLRRADLTVKRPGTGVPAACFDQVVGRKLSRGVRGNRILVEQDLL